MKNALIKTFLLWIPFAVAITLLCGLVYAAVQQDLRIGANDPQIQIAEDAAQALAAGANPQNIVPQYQTDIATSLSPYIILFNDQGQAVLSSAILNGKAPAVPSGVFDYARQHGETRVTWQPQKGIRSAIVVRRIQNASGTNVGFVLVGRSLREVEIREDNLLLMVALGWFATMVAVFAAIAAAIKIMRIREWDANAANNAKTAI
jgi:hypothetical protein